AGDGGGRGQALSEWRRNGAGGQILADLGLGKLRVLGTPRKQIGLAGFGLEVVEYVEPG
ncbi:bifunctional 3,4-dihydroxy-2-butanone-4-phosphate synthase/GTP cyclohydrolase II, partial [Lysobacter maris]